MEPEETTLPKRAHPGQEMEPENKFVLAVFESGIPDCVELHHRTPLDVLKWSKKEHNSFHMGSAHTCLEMCPPARLIIAFSLQLY